MKTFLTKHRMAVLILALAVILAAAVTVLFVWLLPGLPDKTDASSAQSGDPLSSPDSSVDSLNAQYEYFKDPNFSRGIDMGCANYGLNSYFRGNIYFNGNTSASPWWVGAQNFSRFEIIGTSPTNLGDGLFGYRNEGKLLGVYTDTDGSTAMRMEVYADTEFVQGEERINWPHLLIGAEFNQTVKTKIANYDSLVYSMGVKINSCENMMSAEEYDDSKHCAQTTAYFTLQNLDRDSKGYGEFIWFGIPIFDNRSDFPGSMCIIDGDPNADSDRGATGAVIYVIGGEDMLEEIYGGVNPKDGKWATASIDILPYAKAALQMAHTKGLMTNTKWEQLCVGSFNLGWEVTGVFRCSMDVKNISLIGEKSGA